jgi:hypothetical protein
VPRRRQVDSLALARANVDWSFAVVLVGAGERARAVRRDGEGVGRDAQMCRRSGCIEAEVKVDHFFLF